MQHTASEVAALVEQNMRLVPYLAHKYLPTTSVPLDELIAEGNIGLLAAAQRYDPSRGCAFTSFASPCILNAMRLRLRKEKRRIKTLPLDALMKGGDEKLPSDTYMDFLADEQANVEQILESKEELEWLRELVDRLSERERTVIVDKYGLQGHTRRTQAETGRKIGMSQANVSRLVKITLRKMRNMEAI